MPDESCKSGALLSINELALSMIDCSDNLMTTLMLGRAGGADRLYVNIDRVCPGGKSCKFHSHSKQEEYFLVLKGKGILRLGDQVLAVEQGNFFCKPAGIGLAHQFINDSDEILEILDVGLPDLEDVIYYPDENVQLEKATSRAYRDGELLQDWSSSAN